MTEKQFLSAVLVWPISLLFIGFGIWGLYEEITYWQGTSTTVAELANMHTSSGDVRITDGTLDFAHSAKSEKDDYAVVPIRSINNPDAPVSVLTLIRLEDFDALRKKPSDLKLIGQTFDWEDKLPKPKVAYTRHVVEFSSGARQPNGKEGWNILLAVGPILVGISFILMNAGIGKQSIGSIFRRKNTEEQDA